MSSLYRILAQAALACAALHCRFAAAAQAETAAALPPSPLSLGGLFQVFFGLALVLGAVAGAAWLLKRFAPGQSAVGGSVKVVGGVAVGPRERVVLVEVGETWLVVGVAPGSVNPIHSMPRPAGFSGPSTHTPLPETRFANWLRQAIRGRERD